MHGTVVLYSWFFVQAVLSPLYITPTALYSTTCEDQLWYWVYHQSIAFTATDTAPSVVLV